MRTPLSSDSRRLPRDRRLGGDQVEVDALLVEHLEYFLELLRRELIAERLRQLGVHDGVVAGDIGVVERHQRGLDQHFLRECIRRLLRGRRYNHQQGHKGRRERGGDKPERFRRKHQSTSTCNAVPSASRMRTFRPLRKDVIARLSPDGHCDCATLEPIIVRTRPCRLGFLHVSTSTRLRPSIVAPCCRRSAPPPWSPQPAACLHARSGAARSFRPIRFHSASPRAIRRRTAL